MVLQNNYLINYEVDVDDYHGEYDDEAYGSLYIPHIEEQLATIKEVKRIFQEKKIGDVTMVNFTELVAPSTYKGKNKKKVYSAIVYLKWRVNKEVDTLRQAIESSDKKKSQIKIDDKQYWIIHYNTAMFSDALLEERYYNADTENTVMDMVFNIINDTEEDLKMYELEYTAKDVAMRILDEC